MLIESAAGLGLDQLTIGTLERDSTADVWHHALMRVLVAARVNGLLAIDGPGCCTMPPAGAGAFRPPRWAPTASESFIPARSTVNRLYSPDPATCARVEGSLSAYRQATDREGRGAVRYEGEMIDEATRKMAESVARRGRWLGLTS